MEQHWHDEKVTDGPSTPKLKRREPQLWLFERQAGEQDEIP